MASILNTDVKDLYTQWGERVAFNEGFQAQKIAEAKVSGREAFHLGIDRVQGRDMYFEAKDQRFSEVREFLSDGTATEEIADVEPELVDVDPIGEVTDGEETLGMESVVANETDGLLADQFLWASENGFDGGDEHDLEVWFNFDDAAEVSGLNDFERSL